MTGAVGPRPFGNWRRDADHLGFGPTLGQRIEQLTEIDIEDDSEKPDMLVGGNRSQGLDAGENVPGDVATDDLQFGHELILRPRPLIAEA